MQLTIEELKQLCAMYTNMLVLPQIRPQPTTLPDDIDDDDCDEYGDSAFVQEQLKQKWDRFLSK